ncbi:unnamed protein product [Mytilus coruscus]|uniref:Retrotransposon gag domain-containing protein n=1 Tax=Mytilus coruscus TaxID=42192 RepID=A0A6J8ANN2_MYTCO|nr:unnamed protein product [Mytilus coruscus]
MSLISKAEKNLTNLSPRLENVGTLKNIPVVLSDSKGRYLKDQTVDKHPERKIVWWIHPGTTVQQNLQWLQEKAVKTFQDLGQIHITLFIWLGTCDLTFKTDEFLSLNQLREPDINYLLTPSPKLPLNFSTCNSNLAISDTMEKLANCRKFGGYPHENAALFIAEFESYAILHNISPLDDNRIIAALHLHLTGPALTWFNSLSSENKASWEAIVHLFNDKYVDLDWQNPTVMLDSEIFENMSLSSGQSIDDFYCQLVEKANTLKKPDHEILVKFIKGLPEQLAFFVRAGNHRDSPSALAAAKMGEAYGRTDIGARCRSRSPSRSFINTIQSEHFQTSDDEMQCSTSNMESRNKFIYLPVQILNLKIAALVDTGSSINIISQQLFNSIPETHKSWVNSTSEKIVLANNQSVNIIGVSRIKIQIPQGKHWILVHVFSQTSHPLLLGTDYLVSKKIMLDFSKLTVCSRFCKVKNQKRLSVLPNSEMMVWGKVHNDILHDENPALGFTDVVQTQDYTKTGFQAKNISDRIALPQIKKQVRGSSRSFAKTGIISPVGETEDIPITSPIVLVSKRANESRNSQNSNFNQSSNSLSQFRFCCDFRYLNSQSQQFFYGLPELQDLTESFSNRTPNFITHIDLSSGFFQMPISPDSQRYTAFNTCYGTYQFLRLPMGLSSSPGSFQLLMDKVLHGIDSPDQEDPFFPYVPEHVGDIQFEGKRVKFPNFMDSESTDFLEHNLPEVNNVMQSHDSIRNLKHFKRSKQFQNKQLDFGYDADRRLRCSRSNNFKIKSQLPDYIKYQQFTDKCDSEDRNITADTGNRDIPKLHLKILTLKISQNQSITKQVLKIRIQKFLRKRKIIQILQ